MRAPRGRFVFPLGVLAGVLLLRTLQPGTAEADAFSNYVKKSGDYMSGSLRFYGTNNNWPLRIVGSSSTARGICLVFTDPSTCNAGLGYSSGDGAIETTANTPFIAFGRINAARGGSSGPAVIAGNGGNGFRDVGIAFASFPTCGSGEWLAGTFMYDTTNNCLRVCNGSSWGGCLVDTTTTGAFVDAYSGPCQNDGTGTPQAICNANDLAWPGGYISTRTGASISPNATCTCTKAGTGTNFTLQLLDNGVATGATATVSCTTAAGTDFVAAFGTTSTTAGHHYTVSKHANCSGSNPSGCSCVLQVTP